jgi:hypothetical protein
MRGILLTVVLSILSSLPAAAENALPSLPVGTIIPRVVCSADSKQSYALYLPSNFSTARRWPILYVFDPLARGQVAIEVIHAAAEQFGYIVAASNNSRNGPMGDSAAAANAMWQDTQERLPIAETRRYLAGMSGGARVATRIALSCNDCIAGVIANAAGFPVGAEPTREMKFAYYAAVGNADFNYGEFVDLRRKLDAAGARYRIRVFDGQHGWAPAEVWTEALDWMDIQAMSGGTLPRDPARIQRAFDSALARAREFQTRNDSLSALREYQSLGRDFHGLHDVSAAEASLAALEKNKAVKAAEKEEASALIQQAQITAGLSAQLQAIADGNPDTFGMADLRGNIAGLRKQVADSRNPNALKTLVARRALSGLMIDAFESGQRSLDEKNYRIALIYFDLVAAGSANPAWAHYQRARAYAMLNDSKKMLAELKVSLAGGFHESSALETTEFQPFQAQPEFQVLSADWKSAAENDKTKP